MLCTNVDHGGEKRGSGEVKWCSGFHPGARLCDYATSSRPVCKQVVGINGIIRDAGCWRCNKSVWVNFQRDNASHPNVESGAEGDGVRGCWQHGCSGVQGAAGMNGSRDGGWDLRAPLHGTAPPLERRERGDREGLEGDRGVEGHALSPLCTLRCPYDYYRLNFDQRDVIGNGIRYPARPAQGQPLAFQRMRICIVILIYVIWIGSAFVVYLPFPAVEGIERRRKKSKKKRRVNRGGNGRDGVRVRRRLAIAPPTVGRARLRRRRPIPGVWQALILGSPAARAAGRASARLSATRKPACCRQGEGTRDRIHLDHGQPNEIDIDGTSGLTPSEACRAQMGTINVGQAANPGPPSPLTWISSLAASAVSYAAPAKQGFHGVFTPGFENNDDGPPREPFTLSLVSANTTGWRPLQRLLERTEATVIFAQEHRLVAEEVPAASAWARKRGWKTVWAPATLGSGGGASGGTVICARAFVGLRHPDRGSAIVAEGRAVAAIVEPPSCRPFVGYSAYFHDGQGLSRDNLALAAAVGAHWEAMEDSTLQLVLAADFNMEPATFARAGLADRVWGRLVVPPTPRGTCRTRAKASTFDYFYMSAPMADLVASVTTWEDSGTRTHVPAVATFHPRLVTLKALALRTPPAIPIEAVVGPRPPPPDWDRLDRAALKLVHAIKAGCPYDGAEQLLTDVYGAWLDTAEEELADITGTRLPRRGRRAEGPRMMWRSILPEVSRKPRPTGAAALAWLADIARDATRIASTPDPHDEVSRADLVTMLTDALDENIDDRTPLDDDGTVRQLRDILSDSRRLIHLGDDAGEQMWDAWKLTLEQFLEATRARHASCASAEAASSVGAWKEWIRKGFESGAKNAHAYLRLPTEWRPSSATTPAGVRSARPADLLEAQRLKYAGAWEADADCGYYRWPDRQALPRLGPEELREASLMFKKGTATAYDGIHCRHYALLCDKSLAVLGTILEACELLGNLPKQARLVVTPLLEKPKGGFRPVAIYVSLYRLWAKARRGAAADWEATHARPYFSSAKGNGPLDTTWRQGVRQETGVSRGGASACLMWDLESFYECIDRERLLRRAHETGFPIPVVRLSLAMYSVPRVLSLEGRISKEVWPKRGVGAGCGLANTYVKLYTLPPMDEMLPKMPETANVDLHIDDFVIEVVAENEETAFRDLIKAHHIVRTLIEKELGAVVSIPKAALVASSRRLATRLRDAIGTLAGPVRQAAPNLGIDSSAAKRRAVHGSGPLRAARWTNAASKRRRLRRLADIVGPKAGRVFTVGVAASATYHASVQGLTDQDVMKLRRLAAVVYPPRSRFRSLTMTHILYNMPTATAEVAAALHYSRAVWAASLLGGARPRHKGFDLPGLREAWEQVAATSKQFILDDHPDPAKRRKWGRTRGPLASAMLEMHRAGWRTDHPFEWEDDQGTQVVLTSTPPALLRAMLRDSIRRQAERAMGKKWAAAHPSFEGRRLCMDAAVDALKRSRSLTPHQKGAFRSALLGGVLTRSMAAQRGYIVDEVCDLCGECGDSIFHRTFKCRGTEDKVKAAVPPWFWEEAQKADPSDPFWTLATVPHPADLVHRPRDDYLSWAYDENGDRCEDPCMRGHVFIDGSCSTAVFRGLERAALALVQLAADARPLKTVSVPVWATLPQSSQSAEHAAYAGVSHVLDDDAIIYGDCKTVLDMAKLPPCRRFDGRRKYAGVHLSMRKHPEGLARMVQTVKVKAHQTISNIEDEDERWRAIGNDLADKAAKQARLRHPQPSPELAAQISFWERRAPYVVEAVATAMPLFPPLGGKLTRRRRRCTDDAAAKAGPTEVPVHQWEYAAGRWRCARCWTYVAGQGGVPSSRRGEPCQSDRVPHRQRLFERLGHVMLHTDGELPITFCARCGGWSSRRANRLARACGQPTGAGKMALKRIASGLHPWQARDAKTGKEVGRTRLEVKPILGKTTAPTKSQGPPKRRRGDEEGGQEAPAARRRRSDDLRTGPSPTDDVTMDASVAAMDVFDDVGYETEDDVFGHGGALDQSDRDAAPEGGRSSTHADPTPAVPASASLRGTSMPMLLATLRNTPSRFGPDHMVLTFNAQMGVIVKAKLSDIQEEVSRLRAEGVRDDGTAAGDANKVGADEGNSSSRHDPSVTQGRAPDAVEARPNNYVTTFANRAELIRQLAGNASRDLSERQGTAASSACKGIGPHPLPRGLKRKTGTEAINEIGTAVASSISRNAVGTCVGPGDPLRDAGATASAASHQRGVAAEAVTAERMVAVLSSGDLPHRIPPTVAPPRWTAEGTPRAPSQFLLPRPRGKEDPHGGGQHSGANVLHTTVGGPLSESARRRDGADEPPSWPLVARCGADATGPGVEKEPSKGSTRGVPGARNECSDLRRRSGDEADKDEVDGPKEGDCDDAGGGTLCGGGSAMVADSVSAPVDWEPEAGALLRDDELPRRHRGPHRHIHPRPLPPPPAAALRPPPRGLDGALPPLRGGPLFCSGVGSVCDHAEARPPRPDEAYARRSAGTAPAAQALTCATGPGEDMDDVTIHHAIQPRRHRGGHEVAVPCHQRLPPAAALPPPPSGLRGGLPTRREGSMSDRGECTVEERVATSGRWRAEELPGRPSGGAYAAREPSAVTDRGEAAATSSEVMLRRRITGKRKIVHVVTREGGRRPCVPEEFVEPAARRHHNGCGEGDPPEGAPVGAHAGGLGRDREGLATPQAVVGGRGNCATRPRGWTCGVAPTSAGEPPSCGTLPAYDDAYGEMNTLKSTSCSSATAGPGASPTCSSGAAAASRPSSSWPDAA